MLFEMSPVKSANQRSMAVHGGSFIQKDIKFLKVWMITLPK